MTTFSAPASAVGLGEAAPAADLHAGGREEAQD